MKGCYSSIPRDSIFCARLIYFLQQSKGQALVEPMNQPKQGYQQQHEETKNLNYF